MVAVLNKIMELYLKDGDYGKLEIFREFVLHADIGRVIGNKDI